MKTPTFYEFRQHHKSEPYSNLVAFRHLWKHARKHCVNAPNNRCDARVSPAESAPLYAHVWDPSFLSSRRLFRTFAANVSYLLFTQQFQIWGVWRSDTLRYCNVLCWSIWIIRSYRLQAASGNHGTLLWYPSGYQLVASLILSLAVSVSAM